LVDFGVALAVEEAAGTDLGGRAKHIPPEVLRGDSWSPGSDLFSLGATVREALGAKARKPADLKQLLDRITSDAPAQRPCPADVARDAERLILDRHLHELDASAVMRFVDVVRTLPEHGRVAAGNFQGDFRLARRGLQPDRLRIAQAANCVATLVEGLVKKSFPTVARRLDGTLLVKLATYQEAYNEQLPSELIPFTTNEAVAIGKLRNADGHPLDFDTNWDRACELLSRPGARSGVAQMRAAVSTVAGMTAALYGNRDLATLLEEWVAEID
jgi:hypothetical protein